ncbi:helix-turn-helix domain-containing protein [Oenococcus oeni]|uniref:helix-turn-helix domain-containing protein n=4 Tax=Oenococcus oeni TaxID=1247 RepID=UPI0002975FDC|nr:helix-turn-helix domain-containing protein [Oenococcus oeni]EKP90039.1 hypothetical protein AWRIB129_474 [Oenococcus oeni DSM 20252 = AWRIB129]OIL18384.1 DNA-binding protein [Oenococcus oeni]OIL21792.1 DNA-binding protein [Oenococcus oeni]OIL40935.1 DNA-binding protein [Oenococcus oeni]OIL46846.1 DNA-binding protein [Oenococcus oeni]
MTVSNETNKKRTPCALEGFEVLSSDTPLVQPGDKVYINPFVHNDKSKDQEGNIWMNKKQTCQYLHMSNNTLTKLIRRGIIPAHKIGFRKYLISVKELNEAIKKIK